MRPRSALQGRQFEGMDVTCNQDSVELWADMRAAPPPPRDGQHYLCNAGRYINRNQ
jgi:hypothetical protein